MAILKNFIRKNAVMVIAFFAAAITCIFVPVDKEYIGYFDLKTLSCLFCVLAVVCALKNINFFYMIARKIVQCFKTTRMSILAIIYITFIGSMLIANDMALLTFLPLGYFVLATTHKEQYMAFTFIMQNIAANLGGMLTPFGNPQNLYLYTKFNIPNGEFMSIMAPPFVLAVVIITICCLCVKSEPLEIEDESVELPKWRTVVYLLLFVLSIAIVFRTIPYWTGLVIIPLALIFLDRKALKMVDYPLLLTFVFFFIFAGNMSRIGVIRDFMSNLLEKNTLLVSALSCQVISNVPSAVLLSQFTDNYRSLLLGVNIGGTGTIIASLASLITFSEFSRYQPTEKKKYFGIFTLLNVIFLTVLLIFCVFLEKFL